MDEMQKIKQLYTGLIEAEGRLKKAEDEFNDAKAHYDRIKKDMGDVLYSLSLSEVKMQDGKQVILKTEFYGSAAQERMSKIRAFLAKSGDDHIIKPKKISLKDVDIKKLPPALRDKVEFEIHPQSLRGYLNELASKNNGVLPKQVLDLFKVHQVNTVVVK